MATDPKPDDTTGSGARAGGRRPRSVVRLSLILLGILLLQAAIVWVGVRLYDAF